jgi:hypothetical protein
MKIPEKPENEYTSTEVIPDPGALIESLRSVGYSLESAIADIIDNSIFASADTIWINFRWDGENSSVSIMDNGVGMGEQTLINAMRLGSRNPREHRESTDLGRFGLGLKTASFSQCRELTVGSRTKGQNTYIRCWDLDHINKTRKWELLIKKPDCANGLFQDLDKMESGTIVLWKNIDRLVKNNVSDNIRQENAFYEHIDRVKSHLSMIFHRFLKRSKPIKILINGHALMPWDPFLKDHPATQHLPAEPVIYNGQRIIIKPYILPHRSKLTDNEFKTAGGPGGWNARQGFYIYRNDRLIVPGDWLGLGFRKETFTKLARIQVDISNTLDDDWKIDVKKSVARPPAELRDRFKKIARLTIESAVEVFRHRGKITERQTAKDFVFAWNSSIRNGMYHYEINRKHPLIEAVLENAGERKDEIRTMIHLIEETIPIQMILMNSSNEPDKQPKAFEETPSDELKSLLEALYGSLIKSGLSAEKINSRLLHTEPFCDYPEYVSDFIKSR